jgi:hypothetical protein
MARPLVLDVFDGLDAGSGTVRGAPDGVAPLSEVRAGRAAREGQTVRSSTSPAVSRSVPELHALKIRWSNGEFAARIGFSEPTVPQDAMTMSAFRGVKDGREAAATARLRGGHSDRPRLLLRHRPWRLTRCRPTCDEPELKLNLFS